MKNWRVWVGLMALVLLLLGVMPVLALIPAAPPEPSYVEEDEELILVDGEIGEWDLEADFFAFMYRAGLPGQHPDPLSNLYLRYDCETSTLYALVRVNDPYRADAGLDPDDHYLKLGSQTLVSANNQPADGDPPDFHWVGLSDDGNAALGWEAATYLDPGTYSNFNAHTNVDGGETSAVTDRSIDLVLDCETTSVTLTTLSAAGHNEASLGSLLLASGALGAVILYRHRSRPR